MKEYFPLLTSSPLFAGIGRDDFDAMLRCLGASLRAYPKGGTVYFEGDTVTEIGIVIRGRLHLIKDDVWGNTSIVTEIDPPGLFAEAVVCSGIGRIPVSVIAKEESEILFIDYKRIVTSCSSACAFHSKLIRNMIGILAQKNILMSAKMEHITKRTIREKLLSYLMEQARQMNSRSFDIPYNRQELADYLSVERSALSAEMSKLKADGVLDYRKNHFEILRRATP
ncbi:MAG: Crp/Fnr family transcriptional regulator [Christensenellaceae bacterium]|jgi:CRP-like cAMP-binding protein|nr:Crp/Fnr family transcriptional regulator [Christensenellaceae bacterium]